MYTQQKFQLNLTRVRRLTYAREQFPKLRIVVVSGTRHDMPADVAFLEKPWRALDLLREALPPVQ